MKPVAELILAAKAIIANPNNWTQGTYARDKTGRPAMICAPSACQWCSRGAVRKAAMQPGLMASDVQAEEFLDAAAFRLSQGEYLSIVHLNDQSVIVTQLPSLHERVMAAFDEAARCANE
jgi:hypothetical protein